MRTLAIIVLASLLAPLDAYCGAKVTKKVDSTLLKAATRRYQSSAMVRMSFEKIVRITAVNKESSYKGRAFVSGILFRLESDLPEKSLLVFDGETLWKEQAGDADFGSAPQVSKAKLTKKNRSQILMGSILGDKNLLNNFKVTDLQKVDGVTTFSLAAKIEKNELAYLKDLTISVRNHEKTISEVKFSDDVGNTTRLVFSSIEFLKKKDKGLFSYSPPKGVQVNNL